MRGDLERIVWEAECHPKIRSWKIALLNLCYHANAEGEAFPSISTIATETGYSKKAVIDALAGLEGLGIIERSGSCGARKRVTKYLLTRLSTNVHKLANGEVSSCLQPSNGEVSSLESGSNGEVSSLESGFNGEVSSPINITVGSKSVSKLVSSGGNGEVSSPYVDKSGKAGQNHPPEGLLVQHGKKVQKVAPSARYDGTPAASESLSEEYKRLIRTPGWRPKTDRDRRWCMYHCYTLGASREEAEKFIRYNGIRNWARCEFGTVNDLAKEWVAHWREKTPEEYNAERERRRRRDKIMT